MAEIKHTPGPWHAAIGTQVSTVWGPKDYTLDGAVANIEVGGNGYDYETAQANARLIAAAPELLAVARFAHENMHKWADIRRISHNA
jgi:hypothetical protein